MLFQKKYINLDIMFLQPIYLMMRVLIVLSVAKTLLINSMFYNIFSIVFVFAPIILQYIFYFKEENDKI